MGVTQRKRLLVLASGRGSNFEAIARAVQSGELSSFNLVGLVSNRPEAQALVLAQTFRIPTYLISSKTYLQDLQQGRAAYNQTLTNLLLLLKPDLIALAGYMLVLDPSTVEAFHTKIINIHPSLLPQHRGLHAHQKALQAGDRETGCTVHFVTSDLDAGPVIVQKRIPILPNDNEVTLADRLLPVEHAAYVEALKLLGT